MRCALSSRVHHQRPPTSSWTVLLPTPRCRSSGRRQCCPTGPRLTTTSSSTTWRLRTATSRRRSWWRRRLRSRASSLAAGACAVRGWCARGSFCAVQGCFMYLGAVCWDRPCDALPLTVTPTRHRRAVLSGWDTRPASPFPRVPPSPTSESPRSTSTVARRSAAGSPTCTRCPRRCLVRQTTRMWPR